MPRTRPDSQQRRIPPHHFMLMAKGDTEYHQLAFTASWDAGLERYGEWKLLYPTCTVTLMDLTIPKRERKHR